MTYQSPGPGNHDAWSATDTADAIRIQRIELADHLAQLPADAWDVESLCTGWTVRDVVAHLTLSTRTSWRNFITGMVTARGSFDRMEARRARRRATQFAPDQLIAQLRESATSTKRGGCGRSAKSRARPDPPPSRRPTYDHRL